VVFFRNSVQVNDAYIIFVTDKAKIFWGKLSWWIRKLEGKILNIFSRLNDIVYGNNMEASDNGIHQCISKYFLEAGSDKCKWIIDPFHVDSPQNSKLSC
jgi:hypothetical protein